MWLKCSPALKAHLGFKRTFIRAILCSHFCQSPLPLMKWHLQVTHYTLPTNSEKRLTWSEISTGMTAALERKGNQGKT